ncbi:PSD1 and planctomycete cytochrome C domain-containing protein [Planctomycetes bacterium K23_9]|uniref:Planctomycete cytochrome C n=1 Tax=Stieleria marina TaxID=1930275 RepID=A0A517NRL7_9BACT|nr:Planctomycete cytochrome C [Planctomycetes bacterium K23_9]
MNISLPSRIAAVGFLIVCATLSVSPIHAVQPSKDELDFFESKIRPLLIDHCYECHSTESGESEGDLLVDSAAAIRRGGAGGPLIGGRDADKTMLMRVIRYDDRNLQMPPDNKLSDESIGLIQRWIEMGAPDPRQENSVETTSSPLDRDPATHWAFVAPERAVMIPDANQGDHDLVDAFAAARATEAQVDLAAEAPGETLVRRLCFDLTGLPPTKQQVDSFVGSDAPEAYTRLVDRLLASPAFGERFGRHWMDVARYADTVGYALGGKERRIKGSDRFRDWTIHAFATDMPYSEMIRHQLAGDRTDPENKSGNLDAMGFLTIGRRFLNRYDTWDDRIDVITRGLQGMTVACARCHDHKFDPIPASDYYSLLGVMQSSSEKADGPSPLMMVDKDPHDTHVLLRGQPGNRGPMAPRQFLTSLRKPDEPKFDDGSGRLQLADRIADPTNPLTARVMVNRIWAQLIGKPLVDSPSDFGFRTEPPAIPEILDDLSADFASHWSVKRLVRRIVMTRIYRQSSTSSDAVQRSDPENRLLTRANTRRRDFESMRDALLMVSGSLDRQMGGEPVEITMSTPVPRRSVYAMIDRQNLPSLFRTFDFASPDAHSPMRYFTTVPQQALYLLNDRQTSELARRASMAIGREAKSSDLDDRIRTAYRQILQRAPESNEIALMREFLVSPVSPLLATADPRSRWSYGIGDVNDDFSVKKFVAFKVFAKGRWQASGVFPSKDANGYVSLGKEGGHPGNSKGQSAVRRWRAPASGTLRVIGQMGHRGEKGDGIQATMLVHGRSIFTEKQVRNNRPFGPLVAQVQEGQFVDFVASPGKDSSYDSFFWRSRIKLTGSDGRVYEADSVKDFSGPIDTDSNKQLDRLAQLVQVLMISNEFAFVD